MTVKEVKNIIIHSERVTVWDATTNSSAYEGAPREIPEALDDRTVLFISSKAKEDYKNNCILFGICVFIK